MIIQNSNESTTDQFFYFIFEGDTCFIEMNNSSVTYYWLSRLPPMAAV